MERQTFTEGSPWEPIVGYARAVKIGNIIEISGTTATVNGEVVGKDDVYLQTKTILQKFEKVLETFGASMDAYFVQILHNGKKLEKHTANFSAK